MFGQCNSNSGAGGRKMHKCSCVEQGSTTHPGVVRETGTTTKADEGIPGENHKHE
jgi:hypothetical protein